MKTILGLDLGTNSIGWALIKQNFKDKEGEIIGMGSRIIPMSQDIIGEFDRGNSVSQTNNRTQFRGVRRLRERHLLRRERLHRVLNVLNFLPEHYASQIDFKSNLGKFKENKEPKLSYNKDGFIFLDSFNEMLEDFRVTQPKLLENSKLIPYDWTIYYLRKKALQEAIKKEEIAWILLNFNQKRGYYQLRGEGEEENSNKREEFYSLKVVDVIPDDKPNTKGQLWYSLHLENGWVYRSQSKTPLFDWKEKVRDFIVTTDLNDDGSIKTNSEGEERRTFRAPKKDDWNLIKKKTENEIKQSDNTVGVYIYETLLNDPQQKIRGKLVSTIERKYYKDELKQIIEKQIQLQPELFTDELLNDCIRELYKYNKAHRNQIAGRGFKHLFINDIIFYQRPLKSQKQNIGRCNLEFRTYKVKNETGEKIYKKEYLRTIPKSHPLFQEFRLWQWISFLKIYHRENDTDITDQFLSNEDSIVELYEYLSEQSNIKQENLIKYLLRDKGVKGRALNEEIKKYRWNYVEDKIYPAGETRALIKNRLSKVIGIDDSFLTSDKELHLWHIIYSVTDKIEFEKALATYAKKNNLDVESFVENFKHLKPFESEYGSFSQKAIERLLKVMRLGKYWDMSKISIETLERALDIKQRLNDINHDHSRIEQISDDDLQQRVLKSFINKQDFTKGLKLHQASYLIYGRHSEPEHAGKWNTVYDLESYLEDFKQHSLRNPIVEQVITETLRVVRDIWTKYGNGVKDFFDEIHVELGREMKNTAEQRKSLNDTVNENENTNLRIKAFLAELKNDSNYQEVRPYSPIQQEALKIYEDGVLKSGVDIPEDIQKISKAPQPTKAEFQRYKLWLEQKYRSPYTGQIIPLSKLFTTAYQIEHIIPQSRYFDNSFSNKVICEAAVNQLKDRLLGYEFIKKHSGEKVDLGFGEIVTLLTEDKYEEFVKKEYSNNISKRRKLLMEDIPEKMIERQLNDTRYISKFVSQLLSNIVRSDTNDDGVNSKNLLPGNGKVTGILKQDWGLNDVWNDLILPRFERMNELTNTGDFTAWNDRYQKYLPSVPLELAKGFQKKRIDHRHHALDALIIACATRDHINLLNNQAANSKNLRYDLQHKLRIKETYYNEREQREKERFKEFYKPWDTFTQDTRQYLESIIASFKQNLRVINKTSNKYQKYIERNGQTVKAYVSQNKGDSWAIRKSLHKATVYGKIKLRKTREVSLSNAIDNHIDIVDRDLRRKITELKEAGFDKKQITKLFRNHDNTWRGSDVKRVDIYYWLKNLAASRVPLDTSFNEKRVTETVTDTGIQKILLAHLEDYKGLKDEKGKPVEPETVAFTPEGIDDMNSNIIKLNDGKFHQSIYKVRTYEPLGNKFAVGYKGNRGKKYVEADKGTNLFFAIYQDKEGKRNYETIPLDIAIERLKQGLTPVPERNENSDELLMHLSPNDLVYVPENGEEYDSTNINPKRVYRFIDSSGTTANFLPINVASLIFKTRKNEQDRLGISYPIQDEFGLGSPQSKNQRSIDGIIVKNECMKLNIDRLGKPTLF